jgi:hypothetical protein
MPAKIAAPDQMKNVLFKIPDSLHHSIKLLAVERRTTMQELLWEALERGLPKSLREQYRSREGSE